MTKRIELRISGAVQGVGFRPFVFRLANEFGLAVQRGTLTRFRSRYRALHMFVLDDLQLLGTKKFVQQELLHLIDF